MKNSVGTASGTAISFILSETANPASLTSTSFVVNGNLSGVHQGAITLNDAGTVATFVPNQSFIHGERIQVVLTDSVSEDLFAHGLCLPSDSGLLNSNLKGICGLIRQFHKEHFLR